MTFHESTVKKLRWALNGHLDHLEEANRNVEKRRQALADAQEELGYAEERAATLTANVADCQRWLDFAALCDTDEDLAHAFANAVLNRDAEMAEAKQDWGDGHNHGANCTECRDRYEVEKHVDAEARIEREFEAHEANEAWLDAHPDEFANEEAEAFERHQAAIARDTESGAEL